MLRLTPQSGRAPTLSRPGDPLPLTVVQTQEIHRFFGYRLLRADPNCMQTNCRHPDHPANGSRPRARAPAGPEQPATADRGAPVTQ